MAHSWSEQTWVLRSAPELFPVQDPVLVTASSGCGLPLRCNSYHSHCGIMAAWTHWLTIWLWLMPEMGWGQDQGKPPAPRWERDPEEGCLSTYC